MKGGKRDWAGGSLPRPKKEERKKRGGGCIPRSGKGKKKTCRPPCQLTGGKERKKESKLIVRAPTEGKGKTTPPLGTCSSMVKEEEGRGGVFFGWKAPRTLGLHWEKGKSKAGSLAGRLAGRKGRKGGTQGLI